MPTGWETLGSALAGPPPQDPLRSARTEAALAAAAIARNKYQAQVAAAGSDPTAPTPQQQMAMIAAGYGPGYAANAQGNLRNQEIGFRNTVAAPDTAAADRFNTLEAIAGRPFDPYAKPAPQFFQDMRVDNAPIQQTPLADELIGAEHALIGQREAAAARPGAQPKTPAAMNRAEQIKRLNAIIYGNYADFTDSQRKDAKDQLAAILAAADADAGGDDGAGGASHITTVPPPAAPPAPAPEPGLWDHIMHALNNTPLPGQGPAPAAAAQGPVAPAASPSIPAPKSKAEMDALPSGTTFIAPDGSTRIKP